MLSTFALVGALLGVPTGAVVVTVSPSDAIVEVDGRQIKSGVVVKVEPGNRKIRASRKGYRPSTQMVTVSKNQRKGVTFKLIHVSNSAPAVGKTPKKIVLAGAPPKKVKTIKGASKVPRSPGPKKVVIKTITITGKKRPISKPTKSTTKGSRVVTAHRAKAPRKRKNAKTPRKRRPQSRRVSVPPPSPPPVQGRNDSRGGETRGRSSRRGSMRPLAGVVILASGLVITGGVVVGLSVQKTADEFDDSIRRREKRSLKEDAEAQATLANVLYGAGATGLLLGALLWSADSGGPRAEVAPLPGGGGYVGVRGRF